MLEHRKIGLSTLNFQQNTCFTFQLSHQSKHNLDTEKQDEKLWLRLWRYTIIQSATVRRKKICRTFIWSHHELCCMFGSIEKEQNSSKSWKCEVPCASTNYKRQQHSHIWAQQHLCPCRCSCLIHRSDEPLFILNSDLLSIMLCIIMWHLKNVKNWCQKRTF